MMNGSTAIEALRRLRKHAAAVAVACAAPPRWCGWRAVREVTLDEAATLADETVHTPAVADHPLPVNVHNRAALPDDPGWWGYAMRDVPRRPSGPTRIATLTDCTIVGYRDPDRADDYCPAVLTRGGRSLRLPQTRFRGRHGEVLRRGDRPARLDRATWVLERVYHNHSHWLTAHLPKIVMLQRLGRLDRVLWPTPPHRTEAMDASLAMLGVGSDAVVEFDPTRPLHVGELTVVSSDRFRPEMLRLVPEAFGIDDAAAPTRRVYISRARAARRRLLNEDELLDTLAPAGFERVFMEDLDFRQQVDLMRQTAVLVGPHGAGLTNMIFCPRGAAVVEIADPGYPNPNFYALASALGHRYWWSHADPVAAGHGDPLATDLRADLDAVRRFLDTLDILDTHGPHGPHGP